MVSDARTLIVWKTLLDASLVVPGKIIQRGFHTYLKHD